MYTTGGGRVETEKKMGNVLRINKENERKKSGKTKNRIFQTTPPPTLLLSPPLKKGDTQNNPREQRLPDAAPSEVGPNPPVSDCVGVCSYMCIIVCM